MSKEQVYTCNKCGKKGLVSVPMGASITQIATAMLSDHRMWSPNCKAEMTDLQDSPKPFLTVRDGHDHCPYCMAGNHDNNPDGACDACRVKEERRNT